jgi:DNA-binding transcriptional LysR family regulator
MSLLVAVQAGRGVAVVGDFIAPLIGERVRFVPFVSDAHFLEVGLLYRKSGLGENIEKFITAALAGRQAK